MRREEYPKKDAIATRLASLYNSLIAISKSEFSFTDLKAPSVVENIAESETGQGYLLAYRGFFSKRPDLNVNDFRKTRETVERQDFVVKLRKLDGLLLVLPENKLTPVLTRIAAFGRAVANDFGLNFQQEILKPSILGNVSLKAVQSGISVLQSIAGCYGGNLPEAEIFLNSVSEKLNLDTSNRSYNSNIGFIAAARYM